MTLQYRASVATALMLALMLTTGNAEAQGRTPDTAAIGTAAEPATEVDEPKQESGAETEPEAPPIGSLEITGLEKELEEQLRLYLGPVPAQQSLYELYIDTLEARSANALAALGYFSPSFEIDIGSTQTPVPILLTADAGVPVRIQAFDLQIDGPAWRDPEYRSVLADLNIAQGQVFNSGEYEAAKALLFDHAQKLGYFDFSFRIAEVRVSRRDSSAVISLSADSGERYTFGALAFDQRMFEPQFMMRWTPFSPGDPYDSDKIGELTRNLQSSGYFDSVRVQLQQDRRFGTTVPIRVQLERKDLNQVAVGVGFASDTGLRGKLNWGFPVLNQKGHSAEIDLGLSRVQQSISLSYRIPRDSDPLRNYYSIDYGLKNDTATDLRSFLSTLSFQRMRRLNHDWQESIFLRWERESFTIDNQRQSTDLVLPGFTYSRVRSKGTPFTQWGQRSSFQFMYGSRDLLSSIDFLKSNFSFRWLRALSERNTVQIALQYGAISTNDFSRVPVSHRYFAGGDRSIRGFGFRSRAPRNDDGDLLGGRYLEVVNLEHNYRFRDRWSSALFVDAGRAFDTFSEPYAVGAGLGIRWQSPVGPFRLDLARPISFNDGKRWRVHLSLGPDF